MTCRLTSDISTKEFHHYLTYSEKVGGSDLTVDNEKVGGSDRRTEAELIPVDGGASRSAFDLINGRWLVARFAIGMIMMLLLLLLISIGL